MEILSMQGDPEVASVFVAAFRGDEELLAEFVDSNGQGASPDEKWVIILSTQFGCPVACPMCDAGGGYRGDLTADEMFAQIEGVLARHPASRLEGVSKLKIQFARMGEPALNPAVLDVIRALPTRYGPAALPCVATTAPSRAKGWFERLLDIRRELYFDRPFQLQLSINSTDEETRARLMPVPRMDIEALAAYARAFSEAGPRKVALNFALTRGVPVDPSVVARHFNPEHACIKITPLNPTERSRKTGLITSLPPDAPQAAEKLCEDFEKLGFDVILSIGDVRENSIGSNCGMAILKMRRGRPLS